MRKICVIFFSLFFLCSTLLALAGEVLSWEDCIREAEKNNPDLISAKETVNSQRAQKFVTASDFFPQITANLQASTSGTTPTNSTTGKITTADSYTYGVSGSLLVFDAFKTFNDVRAASKNVKASEEDYRFSQATVRYNLRSAFVKALRAQELIRVASDIVNIRKNNLNLIRLRYQSGLEHKGALLTAEANLALAEFELAQAKRNISSAQRELTKAIGRRRFMPFEVQGEFLVRDAAKEKPDFDAIVGNNPSFSGAQYTAEAAAFSVKSVYANFLPQVLASAGVTKRSIHWPPDKTQWDLGLTLTMPIFEGPLRFAQVSQARANYRKAEADARSAKDSVLLELEQAWASLQDAVETVVVKYKTLEAAEERSKIAQSQYSTGFIVFDNWIIIENDLVNAKKAYLESQANALIAEAGWVQAKGETLEYAQ